MKYKHFLYITFLTINSNGRNNTLSFLLGVSIVLFRKEVGSLLQKDYEVKITEL
jgi:hypothetical protein